MERIEERENPNFTIPAWAGKLFVGAAIAACISVTISWVTNMTVGANEHTAEIVRLKSNQSYIQDDIREIKENQQRMLDKLDRALQQERH